MAIFGDILKGLAEPVVGYFNRRQELKAVQWTAQLEFEKAKGDRAAQLIREGLAADASWEMEFAKQAASSWKDEYTLLVVSVPMFLSFIRLSFLDGPGIVRDGFSALGTTPAWYQLMLITLFFATVGIRYWRRNQSDT